MFDVLKIKKGKQNMKKIIFALFVMTLSINLDAQDVKVSGTSQPKAFFILNINDYIKKYVEEKINLWQKKGEFEKTMDYQLRVNSENRDKQIVVYTEEALGALKKEYVKYVNWKELQLMEYDADNEAYLVQSSSLGSFPLPVSLDKAPMVKKDWSKFEVSEADFLISENSFSLAYLKLLNPIDSMVYIYDSKRPTVYQTTNINFNFQDIQINLPGQTPAPQMAISTSDISIGTSDVDVNIPVSDTVQNEVYVLVIGNEDYTKYQNELSSESNVFFARNDASIFAKYCEKTLGIPKSNITVLTDAISTQMKREIVRLTDKAKYNNGQAELIFYYSGHGFPDNETMESYIMPVDVSGANVRDGINLGKLYSDLTKNPARKVTVILDACFSGGGRQMGLLAAKAVKIKPKEEQVAGNLVVFSASSGDQESLFYKEKQHGMFTYFILKKMQETKGTVSYDEMFDFVRSKVPLTSTDINYKTQNPEVNVSPEIINIWGDWKFR